MPALTFADANRGRLWLRLSEARGRVLATDPDEAPRWSVQGLPLRGHDLAQAPWQSPWLFEWQRIDWLFWPEGQAGWQAPFTFWQNGQPLPAPAVGPSGGVHLGHLSLQGHLGWLDWELRDAKGRRIWRLESEVFPQRLAYRADFRTMLSDVQDWQAGLPLMATGPTYLPFRPDPRARSQNWAEQILAGLSTLRRSLDRLLLSPDTRLQHRVRLRPPGQVQRPQVLLRPWLARHPQHRGPKLDPQAARLLPDATVQPSHDTPANRLVGYALREMGHAMDRLLPQVEAWPESRRALWEQAARQLRAYQQHPLWQGVGPWQPGQRDRVLPTLGPVYRRFYQSWQALMRPLLLSDWPGQPLSPRDTPTLYEYWCLAYLARQLSTQLGYEWREQRLVGQPPGSGTAYLRWTHPQSGQQVTIWYQREFGPEETGTLPQRPDLVMDVQARDDQGPRRYLLEVKYQVQQGAQGWGPPASGLAQLHRYRDAILTREDGGRGLPPLRSEGGVLLFPLPGEARDFGHHPTYRSWSQTGVGALPLQPGRRQQPLFDQWLQEVLTISPALREPAQSYGERNRADWLRRLEQAVWLLPVPGGEFAAARRAFIAQQQAWFLPWREALPSLAAVALYDPERERLLGVGKSLRLRFALARDLRRRGSTWPHRAAEGKYVLIEWEEWQESTLPLRSPWSDRSNLAALQLALQQGRSDALWLDGPVAWQAWQRTIILDPAARLIPDQHGQRWIHFAWQEEAYALELKPGTSRPVLWRGRQRLSPADIPDSLAVLLPLSP
jgi:hypothetical protein